MNYLRRLSQWLRDIATYFDPRASYNQLSIRVTALEQRHFYDQQQIIDQETTIARLKTLDASRARELCRLRRENDASRAAVATLVEQLGAVKHSRDTAIIALIANRAFGDDGERVFAPDNVRTYAHIN